MGCYLDEAKEDAVTTLEHFIDEIIEKLLDGDDADDGINDYDDSYHHENHVDKWYNPSEAVEVLEELDDWEETDTGLWDGMKWREMLSVIAAYTYSNCVLDQFRKLIEEINNEKDVTMDDAKDGVIEQAKVKLADIKTNNAKLEWESLGEDDRDEEPETFTADDIDEDDPDLDVDDDEVKEAQTKALQKMIDEICNAR